MLETSADSRYGLYGTQGSVFWVRPLQSPRDKFKSFLPSPEHNLKNGYIVMVIIIYAEYL